MDHIFVVAYGRSGSTLLQGLLNTLPHTLIRGENNFFILPIYRSVRRLSSFQGRFTKTAAAKGIRSAFYGLDAMDMDVLRADIRQMVDRQLIIGHEDAGVKRIGFKEVLWHQVNAKEDAGFIEFMASAFPDSRYILHRRNHDEVHTSGFWQRGSTEEALQAIARVEELQDAFEAALPEQVLRTRYEEFTDPGRRRDALRRLATFVTGDAPDPVIDQMLETMKDGYGPRPFGQSKVD